MLFEVIPDAGPHQEQRQEGQGFYGEGTALGVCFRHMLGKGKGPVGPFLLTRALAGRERGGCAYLSAFR